MDFDLEKSLQILERTPVVLTTMLSGLHSDWVMHNEGGESWSPYDVVGHFVQGERADWIPRVELALENADKKFTPFNRFAQFEESKGKDLSQLLSEFASLRNESIARLKSFNLSSTDLDKKGIHPEFGAVTLRQLLSTWTVHDLTHISQIARVMAKQYKEAVGPWVKYFRMLQDG